MPNSKPNQEYHLRWALCSFNELSNSQIYEIMKLRQEVFVVEQDCAYLDADGYDQGSFHLLGYQNTELVAYARILPPGLYYKEPSVGRIVSKPTHRGKGIGKKIMLKAIEILTSRFSDHPIRIMAQCYLTPFYESYGFKIASEEFLEDGIPHIEMLRK